MFSNGIKNLFWRTKSEEISEEHAALFRLSDWTRQNKWLDLQLTVTMVRMSWSVSNGDRGAAALWATSQWRTPHLTQMDLVLLLWLRRCGSGHMDQWLWAFVFANFKLFGQIFIVIIFYLSQLSVTGSCFSPMYFWTTFLETTSSSLWPDLLLLFN